MVNKGYSTYNNSKILTASPAELTLMLYEGAIKFCNMALIGMENKDIEKTHNNIIKAERIVNEFRITLDFKYEVAKDFDSVYEYILQCLMDANLKKDEEKLNEALKYLRVMRDTWKEVMKLSKEQKVV